MSGEDPARKILEKAKENKMTNRIGSIVSGLLAPVLCAATFGVSSATYAGNASISSSLLTIQATANSQSGIVSIPMSGSPDANGEYFWNSTSPIQVTAVNNPGVVLGTITSLSTYINTDPIVTIAFSVISGSAATSWSISSATLSFPALSNPGALASGAITITESDGNTATIKGGYAGGTKTFQPATNVGIFANLVSNTSAGANLSSTVSEAYPGVGYTPILGSVTAMQTTAAFELSANDQASGTGVFAIVPEPSAILALATGLTGLAGLVVRRRK